MLKIFVGYDKKEHDAWEICVFTLNKYAREEIEIYKLDTEVLKSKNIFNRENDGSNAFTYTRFLVPYLSNYQGWSIFMDADMIVNTDINNLFYESALKYREYKAAYVVKHPQYEPKLQLKMDGQKQISYPRKNWSSVILYNCSHSKNEKLTPESVKELSPSYLHRFSWLENEDIGELDYRWNYLCDEYLYPPYIVHQTNGSPAFKEGEHNLKCEFAYLYNNYYTEMKNTQNDLNFKTL